ncbi:glutamate racemase [Desulfosarcina ovata]|uniref:Glutamate racemase n=1 Tax=Desulfosarcina ovata subsp. ovata TaxID=2752305 RepID=A0A5K8A858_9BACT|nr:glutamate racemase [Desulfosarcina ovata]BBO88671.1 glutamate racemase [Desulfosarcina ovata subsp. ovata]
MIVRPIGVVDSGLGGLSVWQTLVRHLPEESYLYFGDSGYCPYGSRTVDDILRRVTRIVDFLVEKECKIVVVACNAITAASIDVLRKNYPVPFVGMEPAIKPASIHTRTGVVGVLATERTLKGKPFSDTRSKYAANVQVIEKAANGLVEKVESLDFDSDSTMQLLNRYIQPMLAENIDHLVLGCTHYPFLQASIRKIVGDGVTVVNPAPAVAQRTSVVLGERKLRHATGEPAGRSIFYTTGDTEKMKHMLLSIEAADCEVLPISL